MLTPYRHCEGIFAKIVPENGVHAVVIHGKYMPEKWEGGCAKIVPKMLEFVMDVLCENCAKDAGICDGCALRKLCQKIGRAHV